MPIGKIHALLRQISRTDGAMSGKRRKSQTLINMRAPCLGVGQRCETRRVAGQITHSL